MARLIKELDADSTTTAHESARYRTRRLIAIADGLAARVLLGDLRTTDATALLEAELHLSTRSTSSDPLSASG